MVEKKRLKGGSLSSTYLILDKNPYVRKEVSLSQNREYGFQRWYSQLKKLQRYEVLFPNIFPKILRYGHQNDMAYFDMEYVENAVTAHEFLISTESPELVSRFTQALIDTMAIIHSASLTSNTEAIYFYVSEEVDKKILDCSQNETFSKFAKYDHIYFNGECVPSFLSQKNKFYDSFVNYLNPTETFTHGNLTLENILYVPETNRVVFIDPYEENIIDSVLAEYSQLYQSSNSKYEIYNYHKESIVDNHVEIAIPTYKGLEHFNELFTEHVKKVCTSKQYKIIKLLEVSQFIRMLPFKMVIDENKMILFYALASKLFHNLQSLEINENVEY